MKTKDILLALVIIFLIGNSLLGQNFNGDLYFTDVKDAKIMYNDGRIEHDVTIYYHPIIMSDPTFAVGEAKSYYDTNIVNIPKSELKAIYIDNNTWVPRDDSWYAISHFGAIERRFFFAGSSDEVSREMLAREMVKGIKEAGYSATYDEQDPMYIPLLVLQKLDEPIVDGISLNIKYRDIMTEMTSDYPELSSKIANKEKGYNRLYLQNIIQEYNTWFNEQNPGKIEVIDASTWGLASAEVNNITKEELSAAKEEISNAFSKDKFKVKRAERPEVAPAAIASVKPNMPVKKESFTDKINRIKADGNKVGINFVNPYIYIKPPATTASPYGSTSTTQTTSSLPKDTIAALEELRDLATSLVEELNERFDTDVFELVEDINQVPYRKYGAFLIDDWWSTKYKMLMTYQLDSFYEISKAGEGYTGFFRTTSSITTSEFFISKDKPKQKILVSTKTMGFYSKELTESSGSINSIEEIHSQMNGEIDGKEVFETINKAREPKLNDFIAKRKIK